MSVLVQKLRQLLVLSICSVDRVLLSMGMSGMSTYYSLGGCPERGGILFIESMMIDHCILDKATITMDEIIISLTLLGITEKPLDSKVDDWIFNALIKRTDQYRSLANYISNKLGSVGQ